MTYMAIKDLKKTREFREKLDAEGELILTKDGKPFAMLVGIDPDSAEDSLREVRRALFSSAVLRGRRKAALNQPTPEELEAEIAAARAS
jgi:antitoxin (DNA-binding transcriptional repressor) of toxin-antitoxin stability system